MQTHLEKYAKDAPDIVTFLEKYDRRFGLDPVFDKILIDSAETGLRENGVYVVNIRESRFFEMAAFFGEKPNLINRIAKKFHAPKLCLARNFFSQCKVKSRRTRMVDTKKKIECK